MPPVRAASWSRGYCLPSRRWPRALGTVVCNAGNLVAPVDRSAFLDGTAALPPQLFSHADQQRQLQSEPSNPFRYGWGGRMAELLAAYRPDPLVSPLITLSGLNAFQVSLESLITPYGLSNDGALALNSFNGLRHALVELSMSEAAAGADLLAQKYAQVFNSARTAEVIVRAAFDAAAATGVDYDGIFAERLIQRFVTSYPSPGYIQRVAGAFGATGDMKAVIRAIPLDEVARNPALMKEAWFGKFKEPVLQLTAMLRLHEAYSAVVLGSDPCVSPSSGAVYALGYAQADRFESNAMLLRTGGINIGQQALMSPSVFNFYAPDFAPPGALSNNSLVAPGCSS